MNNNNIGFDSLLADLEKLIVLCRKSIADVRVTYYNTNMNLITNDAIGLYDRLINFSAVGNEAQFIALNKISKYFSEFLAEDKQRDWKGKHRDLSMKLYQTIGFLLFKVRSLIIVFWQQREDFDFDEIDIFVDAFDWKLFIEHDIKK